MDETLENLNSTINSLLEFITDSETSYEYISVTFNYGSMRDYIFRDYPENLYRKFPVLDYHQFAVIQWVDGNYYSRLANSTIEIFNKLGSQGWKLNNILVNHTNDVQQREVKLTGTKDFIETDYSEKHFWTGVADVKRDVIKEESSGYENVVISNMDIFGSVYIFERKINPHLKKNSTLWNDSTKDIYLNYFRDLELNLLNLDLSNVSKRTTFRRVDSCLRSWSVGTILDSFSKEKLINLFSEDFLEDTEYIVDAICSELEKFGFVIKQFETTE